METISVTGSKQIKKSKVDAISYFSPNRLGEAGMDDNDVVTCRSRKGSIVVCAFTIGLCGSRSPVHSQMLPTLVQQLCHFVFASF